MTEALLHTGIFALGLAFSLSAHRVIGVPFACAAAYPLGSLIWVLVGLVALVGPWPYARGVLVAGILAALAGAAVVWIRSTRPDLRSLSLGCACFALASMVFGHLNLAVLSVDSYHYIGIGRSLATFGELGPLASELTNYGVFQLLVQSASVFVGLEYLHAAAPLLAASGVACFVVLAQRGLIAMHGDPAGRRLAVGAALLGGVAALAMSAPYFMLAQALYIHTNYAAGVYLLLFCATFWLAELEDEPGWLPFAFAFLLAFSLQRLELPVFAVLFVVLASSECTLARGAVDRWLAIFVVVVVLWYLQLASGASEDTRLLTSQRAVGISVLVAAAFPLVRALRSPRLDRLRPWVPAVGVAAAGVGLLIASAANPEQMSESVGALLSHLRDPVWGLMWLAFPILAVAVVREPAIPLQRLFSHGCAAALLGIVLAGALRAGYHDGWTDSGNRMLTHVAPTLFFFFAVSLGRRFVASWAPAPLRQS